MLEIVGVNRATERLGQRLFQQRDGAPDMVARRQFRFLQRRVQQIIRRRVPLFPLAQQVEDYFPWICNAHRLDSSVSRSEMRKHQADFDARRPRF